MGVFTTGICFIKLFPRVPGDDDMDEELHHPANFINVRMSDGDRSLAQQLKLVIGLEVRSLRTSETPVLRGTSPCSSQRGLVASTDLMIENLCDIC